MDYPTKNRKRAQRRYRDRQAQVKKIGRLKYKPKIDPEDYWAELQRIHNTERLNAKLPELPEMVEVDIGEEQRIRDLHIRRDQDETDRLMRETLGPSSNELSGDELPTQETGNRSS